ncbi:MAG: hypothetical protein KDA41_21340, partial [Planctomycetales bacterium]|nr:hypothetical protein [Planctomycetales bacterium]
AVLLSLPALAHAEKDRPAGKPKASTFIRIERDKDDKPQTLQTAVVHHRASKKGAVVDLVAAVHVGDKAYFDALNKRLDEYDVVLYELVAPKEAAVPRGGKRPIGDPVSMLQEMTRSSLGLESQVECIDYTKGHFVHADLSPDEMGEKMRERGDNGLSVTLSVAADLIRHANLQQEAADDEEEDVNPLSLLLDPAASEKMKLMMARQFSDPAAMEAGLGPTLQRMLIDDRNEAAMKVLRKQIAQGHKRIAIYYGAAHMPDFQRRLAEEFEMRPAGVEWVDAWDLTTAAKAPPAANPLDELFKLLEP